MDQSSLQHARSTFLLRRPPYRVLSYEALRSCGNPASASGASWTVCRNGNAVEVA